MGGRRARPARAGQGAGGARARGRAAAASRSSPARAATPASAPTRPRASGSTLPPLAPATVAALRERLPAAATVANPLDYTAMIWGEVETLRDLDPHRRRGPGDRPRARLLRPPARDLRPVAGELGGGRARASSPAPRVSPVPVMVASTLPELLDDDAGVAVLRGRRAGRRRPAHRRRRGRRAGRAAAPTRRGCARSPRRAARSRGAARWLAEHEAKALLRARGVPVVRGRLASNEDEAVAAFRELAGPVALKLSAPDCGTRPRSARSPSTSATRPASARRSGGCGRTPRNGRRPQRRGPRRADGGARRRAARRRAPRRASCRRSSSASAASTSRRSTTSPSFRCPPTPARIERALQHARGAPLPRRRRADRRADRARPPTASSCSSATPSSSTATAPSSSTPSPRRSPRERHRPAARRGRAARPGRRARRPPTGTSSWSAAATTASPPPPTSPAPASRCSCSSAASGSAARARSSGRSPTRLRRQPVRLRRRAARRARHRRAAASSERGLHFDVADPNLWVPFEDGTLVRPVARRRPHRRPTCSALGVSAKDIDGYWAYEHLFDEIRKRLRTGERDTWVGESPTRAEIEELLRGEQTMIDVVFEASIADVLDDHMSDQRLKDALFGQGDHRRLGRPAGRRHRVGQAHALPGRPRGPGPGVGLRARRHGDGLFAIADAAQEAGATLAAGVAGRRDPARGGRPARGRHADPRAHGRLQRRPQARAGRWSTTLPGRLPRSACDDWKIRSPVVKFNAALTRLPDWTAAPGETFPALRDDRRHRPAWTTPSARFERCARGEPAVGFGEIYVQTGYDPSPAPARQAPDERVRPVRAVRLRLGRPRARRSPGSSST